MSDGMSGPSGVADWREEGRGHLPLWMGAICDERGEVTHVLSPQDPATAGDTVHIYLPRLRRHGSVPPSLLLVRLDNPDVCAAFDRQLALRLGAPEEAVRDGVTFQTGGAGAYFIQAGWRWEASTGRWVAAWMADGVVGTTDLLLARVRAWTSAP